MNEARLRSLYQGIAESVLATIPEDWSKVYLYGEIADGVRKAFFFYYPKDNDAPVYVHNIPELFQVDEEEHDTYWYLLLDHVQELWQEFLQDGKAWTNFTMFFDHTGTCNIDYGYEDLSDANDHVRAILWEHTYLGLAPTDETDLRFLEEHLSRAQPDPQ